MRASHSKTAFTPRVLSGDFSPNLSHLWRASLGPSSTKPRLQVTPHKNNSGKTSPLEAGERGVAQIVLGTEDHNCTTSWVQTNGKWKVRKLGIRLKIGWYSHYGYELLCDSSNSRKLISTKLPLCKTGNAKHPCILWAGQRGEESGEI